MTVTDRLIYLDHAATSYPKSEAVIEAMTRCAREQAGNPGRSGHRLASAAQGIVGDVRLGISQLMGVGDPSRVILTHNGTDALNLAIHGLLDGSDGAYVVTTTLEHNSVLRPLATLERAGRISLTRVPFDDQGFVSVDEVAAAITEDTRMVVITHASNVLGTIQDVEAIAAVTQSRGVLLCVDAAQTAGVVPIDLTAMGVDLLAFSGHKGLGGPTGTGCLCLGRETANRVQSVRQGGTGGDSRSALQPDALPERLEAGTPNVIGLAGLRAAVQALDRNDVPSRWGHERELREQLRVGLKAMPGVRVLGPRDDTRCVGVVSFVVEAMDAATLAGVLDSSFGIAVRAGLHCSPGVHEQLGQMPDGAVRVSVGPDSTGEDVEALLSALRQILG
ncbi:aminotransferase class V-fold PLP-dependent enzyme [Mucisphaera calidilacus]|uniref:cysteine desulfurase n=1 Tax=Mucisphaera calidilacus TaxID=2527982 RepID=A0A518BXM7_9BACT|nr:aminotransferase class V-fold PLP-dependent enzyme [Mucisphaera calidilacus]QDU71733.1 putative cysteine desulfurase [Mucisphaera calidilacus]